MRRSGRAGLGAALTAVLLLTALATPAAAPEETSARRASAPTTDVEPGARSTSEGAALADATDSPANDASKTARRGLLQSAGRPFATLKNASGSRPSPAVAIRAALPVRRTPPYRSSS
jgi:hypothetical protein